MFVCMKIAGVDGECQKEKFEKHIELQQFDFGIHGASHVPRHVGATAREGKASLDLVVVSKQADKTSAMLVKLVAKTEEISEVVFFFVKHEQNNAVVMKVTLSKVKIARWVPGFDSEGEYGEQVAFAFQTIKVESFTAEGTAAAAVSYDQPTGKIT